EDGSHTPKARRTLRLHAPRGFPECRRQPPHARRRRPRPDTAALFDHHTPSRPVRDHRGDPRTYPPSNTRANTDTPACENWATSTRRSNKRLRSPPRRVSVVSGVRQSPTSGRPAIGRRNAVARKTTDSGKVSDLPQAVEAPDTNLTPRQQKVLEVIRTWVDKYGYPPSVREIGEAVGLTSTSSVSHQLKALQRKG